MVSRRHEPPLPPHPGSRSIGASGALVALWRGGTVRAGQRSGGFSDRLLRPRDSARPADEERDLPSADDARHELAAPFDDSPAMNENPSPRARRTRRTEDEQIADIQRKIQALEERKRQMEAKTSPVRKDFDRFKKHANRFTQSCVDHGRNDLANSVMALINTVERQVDAD